MSDASHIKAFRLFDLKQAHAVGKDFQLTEWEQKHFADCVECQELAAFLARQITKRPRLHSNGEINIRDGWYKNLCCGLDVFVVAGKTFPDYRRHKNLPTSWKADEERIPTNRDDQDKRPA